MTSEYIGLYERATVDYIESKLTDSKVKLWADAFNTDNTVKTKSQIFFGHQRTERNVFAKNSLGRTVYQKRYHFEIRVEIFTLRNHQDALQLIEVVLDEILPDFRPFWEFDPFTPGDSGQAQRNKSVGSWIYSGTGFTSISSDVTSLTPTLPNLSEGRIIQVGLFNSQAEIENAQIGELRIENG